MLKQPLPDCWSCLKAQWVLGLVGLCIQSMVLLCVSEQLGFLGKGSLCVKLPVIFQAGFAGEDLGFWTGEHCEEKLLVTTCLLI